jgi:hypothetical protein
MSNKIKRWLKKWLKRLVLNEQQLKADENV